MSTLRTPLTEPAMLPQLAAQHAIESGYGTIVIPDTDNNRIRMVSPGGIISTFAGNGAALTMLEV